MPSDPGVVKGAMGRRYPRSVRYEVLTLITRLIGDVLESAQIPFAVCTILRFRSPADHDGTKAQRTRQTAGFRQGS